MKEYNIMPCPFCGGEAQVVIDQLSYHSFVECQECGARGSKLEWTNEFCATDYAVENWNERAFSTSTSKGDIVLNQLAYEIAKRIPLYKTESKTAGGDPE